MKYTYDDNFIFEDDDTSKDETGSKESKDDKKDESKPEKKIDSKRLLKDIMVLEPSAALKFIAKQFDDSDPKTFLLKNLVPFTAYAVKNGFIKAKDIGMSVKDFAKKNKADSTEIDFNTVDIDEDTMKKIYVIDNDVLKKLEDFIGQYRDSMKDAQKDIESSGQKLDKDIKDAGIKLEGEELADNSLVVAGVIDKPENKKLPKKEKQEKVKAAIESKKKAKKLIDAAKKASKKKVKVDPKIAKMSDEELSKMNAEIDKKLKAKSGASKKNDALRNKLKNAIQKGVSADFKKNVKTQFLSGKNFKKILDKNLKSGLSASKIEDDRVVCISVECGKKDFKKILAEAAETKIIDISKGSKNKDIQKVVDFIKKTISSTFGDKAISDIYAYRKQNASGNDFIYVFAGVKAEALNENVLNEADENWVADHFDDIVAGKFSVCGASVVDSQTLKNVIYDFTQKEKDPTKVANLVRDWIIANKKLFSAPSALKDFMQSKAEDISNNSLAEFIKQSCKNPDILKKGVSAAVLNGSKTFNVDYALASSWSEGKSLADFDDVLRQIKHFDPSDEESVKKVKACITAYKNYCEQFPTDNVIDGGKFNNNALAAFAAEFQAKTGQTIDGISVPGKVLNAAKEYKGSIHSFANNVEKIADQQNIDELTEKSTQAAANAKEAIGSTAEDATTDAIDQATDAADAASAVKSAVAGQVNVEAAINSVKHFNDNKEALKALGASLDTKQKVADAALTIAAKMKEDGASKSDISNAISKMLGYAKGVPKGVQANTFKMQISTIANAKSPEDIEKTAKLIGCSQDAIKQFKSGDLADGILDKAADAKEAAKSATAAAADTATDAASDAVTSMPDMSYDDLSKQIAGISEMAKDGFNESEMDAIAGIQDKMQSLTDWASQNSDSSDPLIKQKVALIMNLNDKLNAQMDNCAEALQADEAASVAERVPDAANNSKEVAKLANNEETKQAASGWLGKFGKALKTFGQAVAVAKIAKFALNNSKSFIDACGSMAVKFKENKDAVAQITVLVNNGEDSDQKFADTRFGIYFSADDLKWHATNLDDRKMKINDEDTLIKRVLDTNTGKEFKKEFLSRLEKVFGGDNGKDMKYFMDNYKDLGIKVTDKESLKLLEKMQNIAQNFDEVKKQFA